MVGSNHLRRLELDPNRATVREMSEIRGGHFRAEPRGVRLALEGDINTKMEGDGLNTGKESHGNFCITDF